jgi:hypothetical protein
MSETNRVDQFKADMADMKLKTGGASKDGPLQILGVVLMVAGIVVAFVAYRASLNVTISKTGSNADLLDANSYTNLAITGIGITIAGAALYLRCALAKFLRFWLLRQMMESRTQLDEVVGAIKQR